MQDLLNKHGVSLDQFLDSLGKRDTVAEIEPGELGVHPVRIEARGRESILVSAEDGRMIGRQAAFTNHDYFVGKGPDRVRTFRGTFIISGPNGA